MVKNNLVYPYEKTPLYSDHLAYLFLTNTKINI